MIRIKTSSKAFVICVAASAGITTQTYIWEEISYENENLFKKTTKNVLRQNFAVAHFGGKHQSFTLFKQGLD